jgi:hypothetical protein
MSQRFLVMGDNHGDTESLQRLLDEIEGDRYAPLARTDDGDLALADDSYGY